MNGEELAIIGEGVEIRLTVSGFLHPDASASEWADVLDAHLVVRLHSEGQRERHTAELPALMTSAGLEWFKLELEELLAGTRREATLEDFDRSLSIVVSAATEDAPFRCGGRIGGGIAPELSFGDQALDVAAVERTVSEASRLLDRWPPRFEQFRRPAGG